MPSSGTYDIFGRTYLGLYFYCLTCPHSHWWGLEDEGGGGGGGGAVYGGAAWDGACTFKTEAEN